MAQITLKTAAGKDAGTVELDDAMFGVQPNVPVMHQVVTAQLAARRAGTQSTKTRSEVRGGGAKPYRQKGTGNARQGSTRAPHYTGGGVALGPKPRKYAQRTPKKMIKLALRSALSDRAGEGKVVVVDDWGFDEPEHQGRRRGARRARHRGSRRWWSSTATTPAPPSSFRNLPEVQLIERRRAQRLRRAVQRLDRVHQGHPAAPTPEPPAATGTAAGTRPSPQRRSPAEEIAAGCPVEDARPTSDGARRGRATVEQPPRRLAESKGNADSML